MSSTTVASGPTVGRTAFLPPVSPRPPTGDVVSLVAIKVLIVALIAFQRFTVPSALLPAAGGSSPLSFLAMPQDAKLSILLPVAFGVLVVLAIRGFVVADLARTGLYLAAIALCLLVTLLATGSGELAPGLASLGLLMIIYLPLCFRVTSSLRSRFPEILEFFQRLMLVAAAACVLQWVTQVAGIPFRDLLAGIPPQFVFTLPEYNLFYPIYYGSEIQKANGVVFLEPSFASQFLALAIIVQLLLGGARWRLALFGAALLATLSGTGMLLLGVGLAALAVRRGSRWAMRAAAGAAAAGVLVLLSPAGELILDRVGETTQEGSSGNARFVTPYANVAQALAQDQGALLIGRGAGAVDRDVDFFNPTGVLVNYSALPKLIGEYGVPAGLVFTTFLLTVFFWRAPSPILGIAAFLIFFVLSGSLQQPQTVYLCWLITGLFAAAGAAGANRGRRYYHLGQGQTSDYRSLLAAKASGPQRT